MTPALSRDQAAAVAEAIAGRLSDPAHVAAVADSPDNRMVLKDDVTASPWHPVSLSDGYPALAVLFAELAKFDAGWRTTAHAYLTAALAAPVSGAGGLYEGPTAVAFAAHSAARGYGGYQTLLAQLDRAIADRAKQRTAADLARISAGQPIHGWTGYDVVTGATGLGRYLLARHQHGGDGTVQEPLRAVLATLVAIATAADVTVDGCPAPAWLVRHDVMHASTAVAPAHVNLGLAHGLAGPLALLAIAWQHGVRVDGHEEAIGRIVGLLCRWRATDAAGPYWPHWISSDNLSGAVSPRPRTRDAWCYGSAGVARALYLAGVATGQAGWQDQAHEAMRAVLATGGGAIKDYSLCHGWAGLLQITARMAADTGDPQYAEAASAFASLVAEGYDPDQPFGYPYRYPPSRVVNRPGLLEGAAGIALALHGYARGRPAATGWDAALLLA
jgi:hypothetical protein